jgi:amino acid adenylation domain-containing protein
MENPTRLENLSAEKKVLFELLRKKRQEERASTTQIVPRSSKRASLPLSFAQQRLWFINQLDPASPIYNVPLAVRLEGKLDVRALEKTLSEVARRHEVLRTTFVTVGDQPVQRIAPARQITLKREDLSELADAEREAEVSRLASEEARLPFDLAVGPLLRLRLLQLDTEAHVLLLTMHHITGDAWSTGLLIKEVATLYDVYTNNGLSPLPELPIQYADYAVWQREYLQGEVVERELRYWKQKLDGAPPAVELPFDRPRPAVQTYRGAICRRALPPAVLTELRELARQEKATLFMVLLAGFNALIYRYTNQRDIVIGTPIAGRTRAETERLIGFFVNTLVLRTQVNGRESFPELVQRVKETCLGAYAHQETPFEKLVEELNPERNLSHAPVFQISFDLQNMQREVLELKALNLSRVKIEDETTKIDLSLNIIEREQDLFFFAHYNRELFDAGTVERMMEHFHNLLAAVAQDTGTAVNNLPLLGEDEIHHILRQWNDTQRDFPRDVCLHELFERQVDLTPDSIAVRCGSKSVTYRELNDRANQIAHHFRKLGVGPETLVGICMDRSIDMIKSILGILKAGAAYLPLDPSYPLSRLAHILEDAAVAFLMTQEDLLDRLPAHWGLTICLDTEGDQLARESIENPRVSMTSDNLAYVIYTSGSTGQPKGSLLQHRGVCNLAQAQIEAFEIDRSSRVLQFASCSFDASVSEIFTALLAGATLSLAESADVIPGPEMLHFMREQGITVETLPPPVLAALPDGELPELRTLVVAGESCPSEVVTRWANGRHRFINAYGPTEATVCASQCDDVDSSRSSVIGSPIQNTQIYILDEQLQPVPAGVPGQTYLGGEGLARGYLNRAALTAEKFIPNPYSLNGGARLYCTGDLARYLSDGKIEFVGRTDAQVKIRGFRIEPGEIEAALDAHESVQQSRIRIHEAVRGDRRLVAYVVPEVAHNARSNGSSPAETSEPIELWPSVAEYFVYDEVLYYAMTNDERRNRSYKVAFDRFVKDKVVLDVGTGPDAILARFCIEAGAKTVYAVELLAETYKRAAANLQSLGLEDRITLIHGDSTKIELPEKVDVCVSEIVGSIGGVEGAAIILNDARRFLKEDGRMVPERSITKIAAVSLPDDFIADPHFTDITGHYVEQIFAQVGHPFDLRLCLKGVDRSSLISNEEVFEALDFRSSVASEYSHDVTFKITRDGRIDGFLVWLTLNIIEGEVIDILDDRYCWLPVYFPVFHPGIEAAAGDTIEARISARLCANGLNPDYNVAGRINRKNRPLVEFNYDSYHFKTSYKRNAFYDSLFADGPVKRKALPRPTPPARRVLRDYLKTKLPDYMVPSSFMFVPSLPLSPNGKVDYSRLPAPVFDETENLTTYEAPHTPLEELLTGIWAHILEQKKVGIHDGFFDLGGHSLLATQLISRVREALQVELPLRSLFEGGSVAEMAALIEAKLSEQNEIQAPAIIAIPRSGPVPLSFAQQRLWFVDQYQPGGAFYNIPVAVRLNGPIQVDALERTLKTIVERHEVLRTSFMQVDGEPWQLISPDASIEVPITSLEQLPAEEREAEAKRLAQKEAATPFDLASGQLLRAHLLRLNADDHVLLFNMHHIVSDGWSMSVLVREVGALYEAFVNHNPSPLPDLQVQYADFAHWQRQWLQGELLESQLRYWTKQLADAPAALELPIDRLRPATQTFHGASRALLLPKTLTESLREMSNREGCTLFMTLLAVFQVMLRCYSGSVDVAVGTDVANRNRGEVEGLIGFFVNQLVMRTDLSGDPTFRELLTRVRETALAAYAHQDLPFDKLVEAINPERDLSRTPLFQVKLLLQNTPKEALYLPQLTVNRFEFESGIARFDLVMSLTDGPAGLTALIGYNTDLFEQATIDRMLGHFQSLLQQYVADPQLRLSQLSLLTSIEERQALVEWNQTERVFPDEACLHQLIETQAARTPDAIALVFEDEQISYGELEARANRLAHHLRSIGVGSGVLVGVCLKRSVEMIASLLSVLKAGGAYVPMDPSYPLARLAHIIEDAQIPVLLTQERLIEKLPAHWGQVFCVDTDKELTDLKSNEPVAGPAMGDDLAYIIYTSGSTGQPKGVMVSHRAVAQRVLSMIEDYSIDAESNMLNFVSVGFDAFIEEVFPVLAAGGRLTMLRDPGQLGARQLLRECEQRAVNSLHIPPAYLYQIIEELTAASEFAPEWIKLFITGGENISTRKLSTWAKLNRHPCRFINAYGPTETSVTATFCEAPLDASWLESLTRLPAGRPNANTKIYVLNQDYQLLPVGIRGELFIGGAGVAWGYLNKPDATAESFIPDPFGNAGARLYRTGDSARYLPDGEIEILGRRDGQVKIRGYRIETSEVVAALERHISVEKALVVARADVHGDTRLIAYVVPRASALIDRAEVRSFIRETLPEYMVPPSIVTLAGLPLTPHGKIDYRNLPAPVENEIEETTGADLPRTEIDRTLCAIWQSVMNLQRVGVNSNFFDIGGSSLLAIKVMARVRDIFHVDLPVRVLFESLTIANFAGAIEKEMNAGRVAPRSTIKPVARDQGLPLSFAQQRLWFMDQLEPGSPLYNCPGAVRLSGHLNLDVLERSLSEIVRRHEILRTKFVAEHGEAQQVINPPQAVEAPVIDLSKLTADEQQLEIRKLSAQEARRPFDLAAGPLLRVTVLHLGPEEHVALFTIHHIAGDGWSINLLFREMAALYEAYTCNQPSPLLELPVQYADYAVWQREVFKQDTLEAELDYWRRQLSGKLPVLKLPFARSHLATPTYRGARLTFRLSPEMSQRLKELSRREEATLFMTLLATFKTLLYRHTQLEDIIVGTAHANRNRIEMESMIGFFINMLVLRTDVSGNPTFRELLRRVRDVTLNAYAHQDVPFDRLVEEFHTEKPGSHSPLFQVAFGLENLSEISFEDPSPEVPQRLSELTMTPQPLEIETVRYDLTLWIKEGGDRLFGWWNYSTDVFDSETIAMLHGHFDRLLQQVLENPDAHLDEFEVLTTVEKERLVEAARSREETSYRKFMEVKPRSFKLQEEVRTVTR